MEEPGWGIQFQDGFFTPRSGALTGLAVTWGVDLWLLSVMLVAQRRLRAPRVSAPVKVELPPFVASLGHYLASLLPSTAGQEVSDSLTAKGRGHRLFYLSLEDC